MSFGAEVGREDADDGRGELVALGDLLAMVVSAVALFALLYTRRRLERWEGALLLGGYAFYLTTVAARPPI